MLRYELWYELNILYLYKIYSSVKNSHRVEYVNFFTTTRPKLTIKN